MTNNKKSYKNKLNTKLELMNAEFVYSTLIRINK